MKKIKKIKYLLGSYFYKLPLLFILLLLNTLIDFFSIGLVFPYLDIIINNKESSSIIYLDNFFYNINILDQYSSDEIMILASIILIIVFSIKCIFAIIVNKGILNFCYGHSVYLKNKVLSVIQNLRFEDYINKEPSDYILTISQLTSQFSQAYIQSFLRLFSETLIIIFIIIFIGFVNLNFLIFSFFAITLIILTYNFFAKSKMNFFGKEANLANKEMIKIISQAIKGFREIKIFGIENLFLDLMNKEANRYKVSTVKNQLYFTSPRYIIELVFVFLIVVFIFFSTLSYNFVSIMPILATFAAAAFRILPSINTLVNAVGQIFYLDHTVNKIYDLIFYKNTINQENIKSFSRKLPNFESIIFENVSFGYGDRDKLNIKNLSFKISKGNKIGIFGKSGSGKTTLLNLILGFLKPEKGEIYFNNIEYKKILELNKFFSYLPQKAFILGGNLKENISLFDQSIDQERLNKSINQANLSEINENLFLADDGANLSGGQVQRLAIARAIYHNRQVLIFDEPTNALDENVELKIVDNILQLSPDKTIIFVSHNKKIIEKFPIQYEFISGGLTKYEKTN